jgi:hypothetical protein
MKAHHFKADQAESKIRKFFDQHAGKSMGGQDADTELESSAEFGCVREGANLVPCLRQLFWLIVLLQSCFICLATVCESAGRMLGSIRLELTKCEHR